MDISSKQYQKIKAEQKKYEEANLRKQYGGQPKEASELENKSLKEVDQDETLKKSNGLLGEDGLKDKAANEEASNSSLRPTSSQEVDKIFGSKGIATSSLPPMFMLMYNRQITEYGSNFR